MRENMVERVDGDIRKALAERYGITIADGGEPILGRAAIEAMDPPTEAMIQAAAETPGMSAVNAVMGLHQARGYGFKAGSFDAGSPLHQAWRAMLTAALKP